jgi:hypothetical protein
VILAQLTETITVQWSITTWLAVGGIVFLIYRSAISIRNSIKDLHRTSEQLSTKVGNLGTEVAGVRKEMGCVKEELKGIRETVDRHDQLLASRQ